MLCGYVKLLFFWRRRRNKYLVYSRVCLDVELDYSFYKREKKNIFNWWCDVFFFFSSWHIFYTDMTTAKKDLMNTCCIHTVNKGLKKNYALKKRQQQNNVVVLVLNIFWHGVSMAAIVRVWNPLNNNSVNCCRSFVFDAQFTRLMAASVLSSFRFSFYCIIIIIIVRRKIFFQGKRCCRFQGWASANHAKRNIIHRQTLLEKSASLAQNNNGNLIIRRIF